MKVTFIRKTRLSGDSNCPSLHKTDRGTWIVVGNPVKDPDVLAQIGDVLPDELVIEVPGDVLLG